jgi:hypothetical protein
MKKLILALLALLALIPGSPLLAQTPPAALSSATAATVAPAPDVAQFLATLPGAKPQAPLGSVPAPLFMASCTSNAQCPTGQLCCNVCGTPPDDGSSCRACVKPLRGRCPLVG